MVIKSRENKVFKWVRELTETKKRKKEKKFLLEGFTFVKETLEKFPELIECVILGEGFTKFEKGKEFLNFLNKRNFPHYIFSSSLIKEISSTETPQGIMAVIKQPEYQDISSFLKKEPNIVILLEEIQEPNNVGAIIRVALAAGASAVFYTKGTADPYSLKSVRASAVAILHLPVVRIEETKKAITLLKEKRFQIIATVPKGGENLFKAEFNPKLAVILGNEARGVSKKAKTLSDKLITIPMSKKAQSLNVAVSAGIILYHILYKNKIF
ncbi:MAG: tRNA G18-methylase SpoU [Thermodesulfobacterium sp.]|uniref:tRNA G18-methylase SpoU n=1 Tax=Candidatus Thermodesulfobacterium syntrophicum TaxID=3060442 RepID=A0AAE3NYX4_9BACT|nr:tRNA G18-methylase SpoU [Candidatus Thermodesulfobacterium syntrophicum]